MGGGGGGVGDGGGGAAGGGDEAPGLAAAGGGVAGGGDLTPGGGLVEVFVVSVVSVVSVSVEVAGVGSYFSAKGPRCHGSYSTGSLGGGKSRTGAVARTGSMYSLQISAGNEPPETAIPWTLDIGISPRVYPIQTAVASCGV